MRSHSAHDQVGVGGCEPEAFAIRLQNMGMMREAIEKRAGKTLVAEDGGPFID